MITLTLIGIGTGNPDHLTQAGIRALNASDLVLIPRKGETKADLAELRQSICTRLVTNPDTRIALFDMPLRDVLDPDYTRAVQHWHAAIADVWEASLARNLPSGGRVSLLVWGDPSLYDSTLRIAGILSGRIALSVSVVPGITALQALTAAHGIALNEVGAPVLITTGRRLREEGWPICAETVAVMLDGENSFQSLAPEGMQIWWGAYLGMAEEILLSGPLAEMAAQIIETRARARQAHGWIMDTYLLRRTDLLRRTES